MHAALLDESFAGRRFDAIFCITRHPIARFVSEYRFRAQAGHPMTKGGIDVFARQALWRYETRTQFVLDNHIRPQVAFPWGDCAVYPLEDGMAAILDAVSARLPAPLILPEGRPMRSGTRDEARLAPATEARLRGFYAADFEAFGYA